jgi:outer membrane lipoprotein carrier protein
MTRQRNPNSFWPSVAVGASRWLLFIGLATWFTAGARAQAPATAVNADDYIAKFEASYHDVHSLKAEFNQIYLMGNRTRVESGKVCFVRGGLMRWDYQRPMEKLFISDGKQVALYVPDEHQLTRSSMKASDDYRIPFEILLSRFNLKKVFAHVELADDALDHDAGDHVLRAYPKTEFAEEYSSVLIELGPDFDMRRLVVNYPDRSRMTFRFDHIERNPALPISLFRFTPPTGTEIIDQH